MRIAKLRFTTALSHWQRVVSNPRWHAANYQHENKLLRRMIEAWFQIKAMRCLDLLEMRRNASLEISDSRLGIRTMGRVLSWWLTCTLRGVLLSMRINRRDATSQWLEETSESLRRELAETKLNCASAEATVTTLENELEEEGRWNQARLSEMRHWSALGLLSRLLSTWRDIDGSLGRVIWDWQI